ncbi:MAG: hypothetical protein WCI45_03795 [Desulfuromonadales bacterium]
MAREVALQQMLNLDTPVLLYRTYIKRRQNEALVMQPQSSHSHHTKANHSDRIKSITRC